MEENQRHLVGQAFQVMEGPRQELREYAAGDRKRRLEWFEKNRERTCDCCRTVFQNPVLYRVCDECRDHVVCMWCVEEFVPTEKSDGLICPDPECHTEYRDLFNATIGNKRRRGDKVKQEYEEATFRKKCPYWQGN